MDTDTPGQRAARARLREIADARRLVEEGEAPAVLDALRAGVRPTVVAADLDRGREYVRRIARANGLESNRA